MQTNLPLDFYLNENKPNRSEGMPSSETLANIKNFSKALSVRKSKVLNHIELILN